MREIFRQNKWFVAILLIAFAVRIIYSISVQAWSSEFMENMENHSDAREYNSLAIKILENGSYPDNVFLDTYRTPVFPVYIATLYFIFGVNPYVVLLSNIILNLVILLFIYKLCIKLFDNKLIALIASALYALEPNIVKLVTMFGTETLHSTLLIISVYYLMVGLKNKKLLSIGISSLFFGLTALTRPVSLYFYLLCIILIVLYPGGNFKYKYRIVLFFLIVYFLTLFPWMFRNYSVYGHFSTNAFQGTAFIYNAGLTKSEETGICVDTIHVEFNDAANKICKEQNTINPFDYDKQKEILGLNYIYQHLDTYIKLHIKGMLYFFVSPLANHKYSNISKIILLGYFLFIYSFVVLGIYEMKKRKQTIYLISFSILIFYFCFLTGILGISRYRMPTTAFYLIICSFGIYNLINKWKKKFTKL
ncbi:MAG: glycosyltransferase family 39 protein [Ignavibacteria bacterium]